MAGKKGQKKRFWSDEEKISICVQTCVPGVSVAQVARRYAMNANLIHKWLRDPKFAPDLKAVEEQTTLEPAPFAEFETSVEGDRTPCRLGQGLHHIHRYCQVVSVSL